MFQVNHRPLRSGKVLPLLAAFVLMASLFAGLAVANDSPKLRTYLVTIDNLTPAQPFSPPVAATHQANVRMFTVGKLAIPELEFIAEDGNQIPMFDLLFDLPEVTDVVDIGMPLTPEGANLNEFKDSVTFQIDALPGDKFSMATMLICTNDGFTGIDRGQLPVKGSEIFWLNAYDAGTENNTEMSVDIVDACSALGPEALPGDPNGNEDAAVDTKPQEPIQPHSGIMGVGDLSKSLHDWKDPVLKVTVTRVSCRADKFLATLSGGAEVPPVDSEASGRAMFDLKQKKSAGLRYKLNVSKLKNVVQAHIHVGLPDENGPVVAFLYGPADPVDADGRLADGVITEADLKNGPFAGDFKGFLDAMRLGKLYVNVHTTTYPDGEIRGQIGISP